MEKTNYASLEEINAISTNIKENKSGIVFKKNNEERVVNNKYNTLIIGEDDNQSLEGIILPTLKQMAKSKESFVVNDKTGKIYEQIKDELNDYNIVCLNFDEVKDSFNIFELSYNLYKEGKTDKALEILENIAYYCLFDKQDKNADPYWISAATNLFVGSALYMFEEGETSLKEIYEIAGELINKEIAKEKIYYTYLASVLLAPQETKMSVLTVFMQKLNAFVSKENICNMLSSSSFDLNTVLEGKMAIFIIEGTNPIASNFVSLFVNQLYYMSNIYGNNNVNIVLDGLDRVCPIKNVDKVLNNNCSLSNIIAIINSFARLTNNYDSEACEIIRLQFLNKIYLLSSDIDTLEYISKLCCNSVYDLMRLKDDEALFIIKRCKPFITDLK